MKLDIAHFQGDGRRNYQQDFYALSDLSDEAIAARGLDLVLADGMGGALDGATIARETTELLHSCLENRQHGTDGGEAENTTAENPTAPTPADTAAPESERATTKQVLAAIEEANIRIYERYREGGGTTLIVARIYNDELWFASVGDSNLYLRRAGRLIELNRRHEFLFDLYERVLDGQLSLEDARGNVQAKALSSFIGCGSLRVDYSRQPLPLEPDDVLIICSDGLSDTLTPAQMLEATEPWQTAQRSCVLLEDVLGEAALPHQDNYTVIVVRIGH